MLVKPTTVGCRRRGRRGWSGHTAAASAFLNPDSGTIYKRRKAEKIAALPAKSAIPPLQPIAANDNPPPI